MLDQRRRRAVTRSPNEEFAARARETGCPHELPDAVIAVLLLEHEVRTVGKNGISFKPPGYREPFIYWSPTSIICNEAIGQQIRFSYDRDNPDSIHLLDAKGAYIETLPAEVKPHMLDPESQRAALERIRTAHKIVTEKLKNIHSQTTLDEQARQLRNADRILEVREFPQPKFPARTQAPSERLPAETQARDADATRSCEFSLAATLQTARDRVTTARREADAEERARRERERERRARRAARLEQLYG